MVHCSARRWRNMWLGGSVDGLTDMLGAHPANEESQGWPWASPLEQQQKRTANGDQPSVYIDFVDEISNNHVAYVEVSKGS